MRFTIPQFIDTEPKIIGSVSVRQFVILLIGGIFVYIFFRVLSFLYFVPVGLAIFAGSGILAFAKVNGQPFHYFLVNIAETFRNPKVQVWLRQYNPEDLAIKPKARTKSHAVPRKKAPLASSRLSELSLIVDTGGVYHPETPGELHVPFNDTHGS